MLLFFTCQAVLPGGVARRWRRVSVVPADMASGRPLGSVITFRYQELTDHGAPRFPTFVAARDDA